MRTLQHAEKEKILQEFHEFANKNIKLFDSIIRLSINLNLNNEVKQSYKNVIDYIKGALLKSKRSSIRVNYLSQFRTDIDEIARSFPYTKESVDGFNKSIEKGDIHSKTKDDLRRRIETALDLITSNLVKANFNFTFFEDLGFFDKNVVAVGANGSGKTTLSERLKKFLSQNSLGISAQRILRIPTFSSIGNPNNTRSELKRSQIANKTVKNANDLGNVSTEFEVVLQNLIADNSAVSNKFRQKAKFLQELGEAMKEVPSTNLDRTIEIWNSLLEHKTLKCEDSVNLMVNSDKEDYYISEMSDGEKTVLYLVAQVLQAPKNGFVIIDEPELYLHKTIQSKLWDILENERKDCIFVYLTHDLDFATSRIGAKTVWVKSFEHPEKWLIEEVPDNEIPKPLLAELLGSRKPILFCEGDKGSIDEKLFGILYPDYTINPVGGCFEVINYTKAFNKLPGTNLEAFGIIDSDHHPDARLDALKHDNVFNHNVSEVENLLLDEQFLLKFTAKILVEESEVKNIITDIINELDIQKERLASNFTAGQIAYHLKDSDIMIGKTLNELEKNYKTFIDKIQLDVIYNQQIEKIDEIVKNNEYDKCLQIFDNKGLKRFANKRLKIGDYEDRALKFLTDDDEAKKEILKNLPTEIASPFVI